MQLLHALIIALLTWLVATGISNVAQMVHVLWRSAGGGAD